MINLEDLWEEALRYKVQQKKDEFLLLLKVLRERSYSSGIEIGCFSGGTTIAFAHLLKTLVSIDIRRCFNTSEMQSLCNHTFIQSDSGAPQALVETERALGDRQVDMLFIDGDHHYRMTKKDHENYRRFVREGGIIAFHDISDSPYHRKVNCRVARHWNRVKYDLEHYEIIVPPSKWGGIGILIT